MSCASGGNDADAVFAEGVDAGPDFTVMFGDQGEAGFAGGPGGNDDPLDVGPQIPRRFEVYPMPLRTNGKFDGIEPKIYYGIIMG